VLQHVVLLPAVPEAVIRVGDSQPGVPDVDEIVATRENAVSKTANLVESLGDERADSGLYLRLSMGDHIFFRFTLEGHGISRRFHCSRHAPPVTA
jgi:hypothetical protein